VARHMSMRVLTISLITNIVVDSIDSTAVPASHAEVMATGLRRAVDMQAYISEILRQIPPKKSEARCHLAANLEKMSIKNGVSKKHTSSIASKNGETETN
jgi:hypothetical protein